MENCWFVLQQTHYPPPVGGIGPIQLGHMIPDFKHLDQTINSESGPLEFTRGMTSSRSVQESFTWGSSSSNGTDISVSTLLPTDSSGFISTGGQLGVAFKRCNESFWKFDRVEREIVQPTLRYVEKSLDSEEVKRYITKKAGLLKRWELFMVTGIAIARGARGIQQLSQAKGVHAGPRVGFGAALEISGDVAFESRHIESSSFEAASDFVWAVRLMRIYKNSFRTGWKYSTQTGLACPTSSLMITRGSRGFRSLDIQSNIPGVERCEAQSQYDTPLSEYMTDGPEFEMDEWDEFELDVFEYLMDEGIDEDSIIDDGDEIFITPG